MQQTKYVFLLQVRISSNFFSTHCIVLKMTYGMKDLSYFLKVNIMPLFLLGSRQDIEISLNSHISVMNYLLVLPLPGEGSNKLRGLWYFWEMNEQSIIMFKNLRRGFKIKDFQNIQEYIF